MLRLRRLSLPSIAVLAILALAILALAVPPSLAQKTSPGKAYTLKEHVREVLTDITVTDAKGNPVTGLPQSAFHVYDNGHLQTIKSFTAHSGGNLAVTPGSTEPGVYSNRYLTHPSAVYNVALIDVTTMSLVQQMKARVEFVRFLQELPPTEPLAIFLRSGLRIVLIQNFTTSRDKLLAAVRRAIPRRHPHDYSHDTDLSVIKQMVDYLSQYPGRKNVLWFSAGSNLFMTSDSAEQAIHGNYGSRNYMLLQSTDVSQLVSPGAGVDQMATSMGVSQISGSMGASQMSVKMRHLFDALEAERIAVYPIDVRGIVANADVEFIDQLITMREEAWLTGGKSYDNTNAVAESARQILDHSGDFYTITYSPNDLQPRGRYHKVRIKVDGPYHLRYRHGYIDDNYQTMRHTRLITASNGSKIQTPDFHSDPIIFQARITPASASAPATHKAPRGTKPFVVHYTLPFAAFQKASPDNHHRTIKMGFGAIVLGSHGLVVSRSGRLVKLEFTTSTIHSHPHGHFAVQQRINLPEGKNDVYLAVWDTSTGRLGTLQIPLDVKRH